jgi:hypothetical protein
LEERHVLEDLACLHRQTIAEGEARKVEADGVNWVLKKPQVGKGGIGGGRRGRGRGEEGGDKEEGGRVTELVDDGCLLEFSFVTAAAAFPPAIGPTGPVAGRGGGRRGGRGGGRVKGGGRGGGREEGSLYGRDASTTQVVRSVGTLGKVVEASGAGEIACRSAVRVGVAAGLLR